MKRDPYTINMNIKVFLLCLKSFPVYDTIIQAVRINSEKLLFLLLFSKQVQSYLLFIISFFSKNTFRNLLAVPAEGQAQ